MQRASESRRRRGRAPAPAKLVGPAKSYPNSALGAEGKPQAVRGFSAPYQLIGGELSDPSEAAAPERESALSHTLITG